MPNIRLTAKRALMESFKRRARKEFPKECYGILLGVDCGTNIEIVEIYYPGFKSTPSYVLTEAQGFVEAEEYSKENELSVVGTIHSHPYGHHEGHSGKDHSQSEADYYHAPALKVHGICKITQSATGRLRSSIKFWGQLLNIDTEIT